MSELKEVPTDELLSFQDYPTTHTSSGGDFYPSAKIDIDVSQSTKSYDFNNQTNPDSPPINVDSDDKTVHSFWTIEYFQKFFDVDTKDVWNRIMGSVIPRKDILLRNEMKARPDLYGPFWISVTLIFTIAISGNIANYLQYTNRHNYHWKYDFHLVSYAATTIFLYLTLVPLGLWGLFKWSEKNSELEEFVEPSPKVLELICIYGYSLFIYIPTSVLWTIQINWMQWSLVISASSISGVVLLMTLSSSINASKQKIVLTICIMALHLLLAVGFMLFFFHVPKGDIAGVAAHVTPGGGSQRNTTHH